MKSENAPRAIVFLSADADYLLSFRGPLMRAFHDRGYKVVAVAPQAAALVDAFHALGAELVPWDVRKCGLNPWAEWRALLSLWRILRHQRPAILFAHALKPVVYGLLLAALCGVPRRTAMIPGVGYAFLSDDTLKRRLVGAVARVLYRGALACAHMIIFHNPDDLALFRRLRLISSTTPVARVNGSGVDLCRFAAAPFPAGPPVFLFVGRLLRDKGIDEFIEAARLVKEAIAGARCVIVGGVDSNPSCLSLSAMQSAQAQGLIELRGHVPDPRPDYAAAHIFVLPSYREGLPRSALEAMAAARPVITTDVPGCRETVIDGVSGLLVPSRQAVPLAQAMIALGRDLARAEAMGRAGRKLCEERFDLGEVTAATVALIEADRVHGMPDQPTPCSTAHWRWRNGLSAIRRAPDAVRSGLKIVELLGLRAGPGLINAAALILVGNWLSVSAYGEFSTVVATTGLIANLLFGPLKSSIVPQHASHRANGRQADYETVIVAMVIGMSIVLAAPGGLFVATGLIDSSWLAPVVAFGAATTLQEILRARLMFWSFGACCLVQSLLFLGLVVVVAKPGGSVQEVLLAYAASHGVAALLAACLSGARMTVRPRFALLRSAWTVGAPVTLGNIAESGLYLGARYLLAAFGTPQQLGVFSFCLDLAQRLVGFPVNIASFVFVPQAFRHAADGDPGQFRRVLLNGAGVALGLALAALAAVMLFRAVLPHRALIAGPFDPLIFVILSVAVILNRVKKLVLDPFVMRAGLTLIIAFGYCIGTMAAAIVAAAMFRVAGAQAICWVYLIGHAVAVMVTFMAARREMIEAKVTL
jgi:glycosyltransferase involved in cell wall biosynthesis/O-antigen/teichoic acid export membrane protein